MFPGLIQDLGSTVQITGIYRILQIITPVSVGANTTAVQTFTVPGVMPGDSIDINKPSHQTGLNIGNVFVTGANLLQIQYVNTTAGAIVPASEQYIIGGQR